MPKQHSTRDLPEEGVVLRGAANTCQVPTVTNTSLLRSRPRPPGREGLRMSRRVG